MTETKTNRKFKDSVFTLLFSEKSSLLELYNAIENTSYGNDTNIRITTLDDAKRVWQREAREDGIEIGREEGVAIGMKKLSTLLRQGYSLEDAKKLLVT